MTVEIIKDKKEFEQKLDLRNTSLTPGLTRIVPEDLLFDGGGALATPTYRVTLSVLK